MFNKKIGIIVLLYYDLEKHAIFCKDQAKNVISSINLPKGHNGQSLRVCVSLGHEKSFATSLGNDSGQKAFESNFSRTERGGSIFLLSPTEISFLSNSGLCLLEKKIVDKHEIKFEILRKASSLLSIGVALKSVATNNRLQFKHPDKDGCFLFCANGLHCIYKLPSLQASSPKNLAFKNGDLLLLSFDFSSRILKLVNALTGYGSEMRIDEEFEIEDLFPCVYLNEKDETVRII